MKGMVVAPQPRAAEVGAWVLSQGGNAFDALIATAFCQMVVDPFMSSPAGMGACQYYTKDGRHGSIDFHTTAGSKVRAGMWEADARGQTAISGYTVFDDHRSELGYSSIMTPASVAGFGAIHKELATWDWADLLAPAIDILGDGFALPRYVQNLFGRPIAGEAFGREQLTATPEMQRIWLKADGSFYQGGDLFRNDDFVRSLKRLAENGPQDFYTGGLAKEMADDLERNGAFVTADDLANYRPRHGQPLHTSYHGYDIYSARPPASGMTLIEILNVLEGFDLASLTFGSTEYYHLIALTMAWAHRDRRDYLGDPEFVDVPIERLTSKAHAAAIRERVLAGEFPDYSDVVLSGDTTQVTTWDAEGNVATTTHTLVACSGVITPGLGYIYNNSMKLAGVKREGPNALAPGKARNVGMCPTLVFKDGKLVMALGAPGGSVIISSVLQTILNIVHRGMTPVEAVSAPRIHCEGGAVFCESRILSRTIEGLRQRGHKVKHQPDSFDMIFSRPQVIVAQEDGTVRGGSDPRHEGGIPIVATDDGGIAVMPYVG